MYATLHELRYLTLAFHYHLLIQSFYTKNIKLSRNLEKLSDLFTMDLPQEFGLRTFQVIILLMI